MDIANTKISHLIESQVPFFVRNDHSQFVAFLEAYYQYLEQETKTLNVSKNLPKQFNIDLSEDTYADLMYNTFMRFIPTNVLVDKRMLLKHIKDFYRAKGTEKATRFLFRILYNIEIEFYYPKKDVLRASDGKWYVQKSLRVSDVRINGVANTELTGLAKFVTTRITSSNTASEALVESVDRFYEQGTQIDELVLSNIDGEFISGESVTASFDENGETKSISANIFGDIINSFTIVNAGSGYEVGDPVIIISSSGAGACAVVGSVSTGSIIEIANFGGGAGYQANDAVVITGGGGNGAHAILTTVSDNNVLHPNSYNIVASSLAAEGNTIAGNTTYETFAYQSLSTLWVNTANIRINTGAGAAVNTVNLSGTRTNSNIWFETYDTLNVNGNLHIVTSSNTVLDQITVTPGIRGNLVLHPFQVYKKPNINSIIGESVSYWIYANTGPAGAANVVSGGSNYTGSPTISITANSIIQSLGILGAMEIVSGGMNYVIGDEIEFINGSGSYGFGARANVTNVDRQNSNTITAVYWKELPGHIIGGSGYTTENLPRANVISATGNGANIVVTALLASGADLRPTASDVGAIQRILIVNRGSNYRGTVTADLSGSGDGTANVTVSTIEGLFTYTGRYLNDDGHLSSHNFLQDRDFYQDFSYVIRSGESVAKYRKAVKQLIHPAGTKLFGEFLYYNAHEYDMSAANANTIMTQTFFNKAYVKTGNTINIAYLSHGLSLNANVRLEFQSGGFSNVRNGIYMITETATNFFKVKHPSNVHIISITQGGRGYNANSYLVFTGDGKAANASYVINANGSIISTNTRYTGFGFFNAPTVTANGSNTIAATFTANLYYATDTTGNVLVGTIVT
jgi:hypothetical protein